MIGKALLARTVALIALAAGGCAPAAAPAPTPTSPAATPIAAAPPPASAMVTPVPRAVRFADVPSIALAPLYVAIERGYFAEQGLDVRLERVAGGAEAVSLVGTGQVDANAGAVSAGLFNAVQRGIDVRIVAPMSFLPTSGGATPLLVRRELAETVRGPGDVRGRSIAINVRGGNNEYLLVRALAPAGLGLGDVELAIMPFPDMAQALAQGSVDLALPAEPFASQALASGAASTLIESIAPGLMNTVVIFSPGLRADTAAAQGFLVALMRAARDLQGDAAKRDEQLRVLERHTGVSAAVLQASAFNAWDPDLTIQTADLLDQQRVHIQNGRTEYSEPLPIERLVDDQYQRAALAQLGGASRRP